MNNTLEETIGGRIRKARIANKLTLRELAARAGVSLNHLSLVERGLKNPSVALLERIADALGVAYDRLDTGAISEPSPPIEPDVAQIDLQLLFTLIMMGNSHINVEYLASALRTTPDTIKGILSGADTANRPLWRQDIKVLCRQLNVGAVCSKMEALLRYLRQEENEQKEERYAALEDALLKYFAEERYESIQRQEPICETDIVVPEVRMLFTSCNGRERYVEVHYIDDKAFAAGGTGCSDDVMQEYITKVFADFTADNCEYFVVLHDEALFEQFVKKANAFSAERLNASGSNPDKAENLLPLVDAILMNEDTFNIVRCEDCCVAETNAYREITGGGSLS